jgi:flagellar biosynthetic protein FliQ
MDPTNLISIGKEAAMLMVLVSAPPVLASLVVGVAMSLFQATTQIQESTISVVPKILASTLALSVAAPWIGSQLARFTTQVLTLVPGVGQ